MIRTVPLTGSYPMEDRLRGMLIVWESSTFCVHYA